MGTGRCIKNAIYWDYWEDTGPIGIDQRESCDALADYTTWVAEVCLELGIWVVSASLSNFSRAEALLSEPIVLSIFDSWTWVEDIAGLQCVDNQFAHTSLSLPNLPPVNADFFQKWGIASSTLRRLH